VHSCVSFTASASTTYYLQADGWQGAKGTVSAAVTVSGGPPAPSNDAFAAAGATFPATGTTVGATPETGEPRASGAAAGASVWWRFAAPPSVTSATVRLAVLVVRMCVQGVAVCVSWGCAG
jgi:hypothetical protein